MLECFQGFVLEYCVILVFLNLSESRVGMHHRPQRSSEVHDGILKFSMVVYSAVYDRELECARE